MGDIRHNNLFDLLDEDAPVRQPAKPAAAAPAQQPAADKNGRNTNRERPAAPATARGENGGERGRGRGGRGRGGRGGRGRGNRDPKHEQDRRGVHGAKVNVKKNGAGQFNWDNEQVAQEQVEAVETPVEVAAEEVPAEIVEEVVEVPKEEDDVVTLEEHLKRIKAPEDDKKQAREVVVDEKAFHKVKAVEKKAKGPAVLAAAAPAPVAEKKSDKQRKTVSLDEFVGSTPVAPAPAFSGERGARGGRGGPRGGRGGPRGGRGGPRGGAPRGGPRGGRGAPRGGRNNGPAGSVNLSDDSAFPKLGKN